MACNVSTRNDLGMHDVMILILSVLGPILAALVALLWRLSALFTKVDSLHTSFRHHVTEEDLTHKALGDALGETARDVAFIKGRLDRNGLEK